MSRFEDDTVTLEFALTTRYSYTGPAETVASTAGLSLDALRRVIEDGEELPADAINQGALVQAADYEGEEFELLNTFPSPKANR